MTTEHIRILSETEGWFDIECGCGWFEGPFVDRDDAIDSYCDHLKAVGDE